MASPFSLTSISPKKNSNQQSRRTPFQTAHPPVGGRGCLAGASGALFGAPFVPSVRPRLAAAARLRLGGAGCFCLPSAAAISCPGASSMRSSALSCAGSTPGVAAPLSALALSPFACVQSVHGPSETEHNTQKCLVRVSSTII